MPEYLAPGVFVEEVSFRAKSIEGVGTSVAGIVGPTRTGPLRGKPEVATSFARFVQVFGDAADLALGAGDNPPTVLNHTAIAARAFFDNGGKQLFVVRVARHVNDTDSDGAVNAPGAPTFATRADANNHVRFHARFPGAAGNCWLELAWRNSANLLQTDYPASLADGETAFLTATGLPIGVRDAALGDGDVPDASFPLSIQALVTRDGARYRIVGNRAVITAAIGVVAATALAPAAGEEGALMAAALVNGPDTEITFTRITARPPASGPLDPAAAPDEAELRLARELDLSAHTGAAHWGRLRALRGTLTADGTVFTVAAGGPNVGVAAPIAVPLSLLAAGPPGSAVVQLREDFDLDVRRRGTDGGPGEVVWSIGNLSIAPTGERSLGALLPARPERREQQLIRPIRCTIGAGATTRALVLAALDSLFEPRYRVPVEPNGDGPRYLIELRTGSDGEAPVATDYTGETDITQGSTGFAALEDIEDVSILMCPAAAAHAESHQGVVSAMWSHCNRMRYRVGIVDSRQGMALSEVRELASQFPSNRLALYYPWIVTSDPTGVRPEITVPPAGFIAGIYANTDVNRGVHKAPANEPIIGALRLAQDINRFQQELLNPNGVNCLRSFPGGGHRVWGGRTLDVRDPEWKYVNVRRYFLYLERSIDKSTQWVVFEPNGERLWANVRSAVEDFLYNEWFNGRLLGGSPKAAYFVRCDRSTMTQNDLDNGRLVCLVGVAPLTPAEFVIFRVGQKTADG
ncbi:phage tail sheath subtilisin-like domain-containing protein [Thiohalocapsa sp. ML1]|uniref:phage tail sheath family protein n=1 Tax=Thiohalocapsa sp. ML1 TaxID=1431688 RepID=UPI0007323D7F|nr:phage tail sheath subtilisin-like domain-containing protein [Thiohalocapsa sp. ML1]